MPTPLRKLRPLDAFEGFFWMANRMCPVHTTVAMTMTGGASLHLWRGALAAVCARHPMLLADVVADREGCHWFVESERSTIPLRVVDDDAPTRWRHEVEQELALPFPAQAGPLARIVLVRGRERTTILTSAHHAIVDGRSAVRLVKDLVAAIGGVLPPQGRLLPSLEALIGLPCLPLRAGPRTAPCPPCRPAAIDTSTLDIADTAKLRARSREEHTTVHGTMLAAAVTTLLALDPARQQRGLMALSPIDLRPALGVDESYGQVIGTATVAVPPGPPAAGSGDFWALARSLKRDVDSQRGVPASVAAAKLLRDTLARPDADMAEHLAFYGTDLLVSNLGRLPPARPAEARIEQTHGWFAPIDFGRGTQAIIFAAVDDRLELSYCSRAPVPGFVDGLKRTLGRYVGLTTTL
jgi:hypothetical protein